MTSGEAESKVQKIETIADGVVKRSEAACHEPKPLFVLSEVRDRTHTIGSGGFAYAQQSASNRCGDPPSSCDSEDKSGFIWLEIPLQIDSIWRAARQNAALNKGPPVDGGGLFLRGRSQETPSPLLSFLLFSLAASARPLLPTASAVRTPPRHSVSFSAPPAPRLLSCIFQGRSHLTYQVILKRSDRQVICKGQSDLTHFKNHMIKALSSNRLLVLLYNCSSARKKRDKLNKRVDDVFASVIKRRFLLIWGNHVRASITITGAQMEVRTWICGGKNWGGGSTWMQSRPRRDLWYGITSSYECTRRPCSRSSKFQMCSFTWPDYAYAQVILSRVSSDLPPVKYGRSTCGRLRW